MEKIVVPANLKSLESAIRFIIQGAVEAGLSEKKLSQLQLAAEEILVNIMNYAYPDQKGDIEITYSPKQDGVEIEVADQGLPFDPLSLPKPDINAPLEERNIGGLGIHLVRNTMDEVRYKREGSRNILTFFKH